MKKLLKKLEIELINNLAEFEGINTDLNKTYRLVKLKENPGFSVMEIIQIENIHNCINFILDTIEDELIRIDYNYYLHLNKILSTGLNICPGKLRNFEVRVGGSKYIPPMPIEYIFNEDFNKKLETANTIKGIFRLGIFCMKCQPFEDVNKRTATMLINSLLIRNRLGVYILKKEYFEVFKDKLLDYYENRDEFGDRLVEFMVKNCFIDCNSNYLEWSE